MTHIVGQGRGQTNMLPCNRMDEPHGPAVKGMAADAVSIVRAIHSIPRQRMAYVGHMSANLMGASGFNAHAQQSLMPAYK